MGAAVRLPERLLLRVAQYQPTEPATHATTTAVIASEATQSRATNRINGAKSLDSFTALAMTAAVDPATRASASGIRSGSDGEASLSVRG